MKGSVGTAPLTVELAPGSFDDPAQDRTLHHELAFSAQVSAGSWDMGRQ
jgi:hypothetical protein